MNYTELIHRFFDEGLESPLEDSLFRELSVNADLQKEFIDHLRIHSFVTNDINTVAPSAELSAAIFQNIGSSSPETATILPLNADTTAKIGPFNKAILYIRKSVPWFSMLALITLLTYGLVTMIPERVEKGLSDNPAMSGKNNLPNSNTENPPAANNPPEIASNTVDKSISGETSRHDNAGSSQQHRGIRPTQTNPASGMPVEGAGSPLTEERGGVATIPDRGVRSDEIAALSPEVPLRDRQAFASESPDILLNAVSGGIAPYAPSDVTVQIRFQSSEDFRNVSKASPNNPGFLQQNMAVVGLYALSERHAIGMEYGRETYGRRYIYTALVPDFTHVPSTSGNPEIPLIAVKFPGEDYKTIHWVTAVWKMSLPEYKMFGLAYPFTQAAAGGGSDGHSFGPIGKLMAGLEFHPLDNSVLNLAAEYSVLGFSIEKRMYVGQKLGFTLGAGVTF